MEDDEFLHNLKAFTGDDAAWDGFDPTAWRSVDSVDGQPGGLGSATDEPDESDAYESDDSAEMILNLHKLTPDEKRRAGKLNKAREYASTETGFPRELAELEKVEWKETGLANGAVSAEGDRFVALRLVESYPDMFVGKANGVRAAPLFTDEALHENRVWDLYYIHCPRDLHMKPVIMVPTYQFQHLLDVVNAKLETRLTIPPGRNEERFMMLFGIGNSPRPRFLGRSNSLESFKALCKAIPAPHPDDDLTKATKVGLEEFRQLLKRSRADKRKGKKSDKNRSKRIAAHRACGRSIKRVQRYLGLRGRVTGKDQLAVVDLSQPMIDAPESAVLFVAIDVEAWERNQNLITEVGIAMLDTTEILGTAPGDGGQNWFPFIRARHIRVKENSWAENSRYVHGCADRFSFGTSEFVNESLIKPLIQDVVDNATHHGTTQPRPVVLVFHESASDIKYLKLLSYHAETAQNVVEAVDTREMHQSLVRSNDSASLSSVLTCLGIPHRHLHNAGNDAVYTMQAMIGLAVRKRVMGLEKARENSQDHVPDSDLKEKDGWTSGEDTDGGDPVRLVATRTDTGTGWGSEDIGGQRWDSEDVGVQGW